MLAEGFGQNVGQSDIAPAGLALRRFEAKPVSFGVFDGFADLDDVTVEVYSIPA